MSRFMNMIRAGTGFDPERISMYGETPGLMRQDLGNIMLNNAQYKTDTYTVGDYSGKRVHLFAGGGVLGMGALASAAGLGSRKARNYIKRKLSSSSTLKSISSHKALGELYKHSRKIISKHSVALGPMAAMGAAGGFLYHKMMGTESATDDMVTGGMMGAGGSFFAGAMKRGKGAWGSLRKFSRAPAVDIPKITLPSGYTISKKAAAKTSLAQAPILQAFSKVVKPGAYGARLAGGAAIAAAGIYLGQKYLPPVTSFLRNDPAGFHESRGGYLSQQALGMRALRGSVLGQSAMLAGAAGAAAFGVGHVIGKSRKYQQFYSAAAKAKDKSLMNIKYKFFKDNAFVKLAERITPKDVQVGKVGAFKGGRYGGAVLRTSATLRNMSWAAPAAGALVGFVGGSMIDSAINYFRYLSHPGRRNREDIHTFSKLGAAAGAVTGLPFLALGQTAIAASRAWTRIKDPTGTHMRLGEKSKTVGMQYKARTERIARKVVGSSTGHAVTGHKETIGRRLSGMGKKLWGTGKRAYHTTRMNAEIAYSRHILGRTIEFGPKNLISKQKSWNLGGRMPSLRERGQESYYSVLRKSREVGRTFRGAAFAAGRGVKDTIFAAGRGVKDTTFAAGRSITHAAGRGLGALYKGAGGLLDKAAEGIVGGITRAHRQFFSTADRMAGAYSKGIGTARTELGRPGWWKKSVQMRGYRGRSFEVPTLRSKAFTRGKEFLTKQRSLRLPKVVTSPQTSLLSRGKKLFEKGKLWKKSPRGAQILAEMGRFGKIGVGLGAAAAVGAALIGAKALEKATGLVAGGLENIADRLETQPPPERRDYALAMKNYIPMNYAMYTLRKQMNRKGPMSPNNLSSSGVGLAAHRKRHGGWL